MEFIERDCAEHAMVEMQIEAPSALRQRGEPVVLPSEMPLPIGCDDPGDVPLAWICGRTLDGERIWVPAHEVLCPFPVPPGAHNPIAWHSSGLAAGSHPTEAIFYGLVEVLERDAVAIAELAKVGTSVDLAAVDWDPLATYLRVAAAGGLRVEVKELPAAGGVHVYLGAVEDPSRRDAMQLVVGHGAHVEPRLALERAVLEAAQARAVITAGAREDLDHYKSLREMSYEEARRQLAWWFDPTGALAPPPLSSSAASLDLRDTVLEIRRTLLGQGFDRLIVVDLSPPGSSLAVFRVLLPGASEVSRENVRIGRRLLVG
jgi:ribosomal protein S12 methylthiotransferase accessory factor